MDGNLFFILFWFFKISPMNFWNKEEKSKCYLKPISWLPRVSWTLINWVIFFKENRQFHQVSKCTVFTLSAIQEQSSILMSCSYWIIQQSTLLRRWNCLGAVVRGKWTWLGISQPSFWSGKYAYQLCSFGHIL